MEDELPSNPDPPRSLRSFLASLPRRLPRPRWASLLLVLLSVLVFWRVWHLRTAGHWDFMTYYWAAKAHAAGLDPYQLSSLSQVAGQKVVLPYLYPPGVLYLLRPLTHLSLPNAIAVYVSLKLGCLVALFLLWRACLGKHESLALFALTVFGFSDAVFNDFFAGNVATFEQLALWLGFWGLWRQRIWLFAAMVVLAAVPKMTPLCLLGLLLLPPHRHRVLAFAAGMVAGILSITGSFGGSWTKLASYFLAVMRVDERGPTNTSMLALLKDIDAYLPGNYRFATVASPTVLYAVAAILVTLATGFVLFRLYRRHRDDPQARLDIIMGAVLLYALALPRFKDYSYALLIPVVVFVGRRIRNALPVVILLACLTTRNTLARYTLGGFPLADLTWKYFNLIITGVLWTAFLFYAWARGTDGATRQEEG